ncbi:MAG: aldo/keto reductase [Acidobacteria bacterium]|nr:aldo/keto reductase [Acidobacteriota bacterium]
MKRRTFLQASTAAAAAGRPLASLLADTPIPHRRLGKTGLDVTILALGGYHMGLLDDDEAIRLIHRAIDLGINFLDSAWSYHDGHSDELYGMALTEGRRQKIYLMTKANKRDRAGAQQQLEDGLRRMRTDYLDLWQVHEVSTPDEVDRIFGPNGALEVVVKAKKEGKVRHIGFTGHHDPPRVPALLLEPGCGRGGLRHGQAGVPGRKRGDGEDLPAHEPGGAARASGPHGERADRVEGGGVQEEGGLTGRNCLSHLWVIESTGNAVTRTRIGRSGPRARDDRPARHANGLVPGPRSFQPASRWPAVLTAGRCSPRASIRRAAVCAAASSCTPASSAFISTARPAGSAPSRSRRG